MQKAVHIDGAELVRAKRWSRQRFEKLVRDLRSRGVTDGEIARAMSASTTLVDAVGRAVPPRRPQYGKPQTKE